MNFSKYIIGILKIKIKYLSKMTKRKMEMVCSIFRNFLNLFFKDC